MRAYVRGEGIAEFELVLSRSLRKYRSEYCSFGCAFRSFITAFAPVF